MRFFVHMQSFLKLIYVIATYNIDPLASEYFFVVSLRYTDVSQYLCKRLLSSSNKNWPKEIMDAHKVCKL